MSTRFSQNIITLTPDPLPSRERSRSNRQVPAFFRGSGLSHFADNVRKLLIAEKNLW